MTDETTIPLNTLSRLFHVAVFEHDDTRITQQTLEMSAEYLRMFIREAVLRANETRISRAQGGEDSAVTEQPVSDVLDTRDLDDIAGMMVLDF
ncbi:unnamed protein product [Cyberlindnera jadinii]|uniref:Centromere protein X n=1 Tax=Cyberlindnera jadinii (strain ATCC 18201 / CBS 1600 / BCRC 20928 / JCM 3617 / NBRC 0987 / NRRL Y-1542) TaxID=983966 RepID=A0A0H5C5C1_CYBJN|nr:unnamed protein product [Cyberlindnera jadinii]